MRLREILQVLTGEAAVEVDRESGGVDFFLSDEDWENFDIDVYGDAYVTDVHSSFVSKRVWITCTLDTPKQVLDEHTMKEIDEMGEIADDFFDFIDIRISFGKGE